MALRTSTKSWFGGGKTLASRKFIEVWAYTKRTSPTHRQRQWRGSSVCSLAVLQSATDPVAVVALLKELGASKKLGTLIEGESLLNDGTAIVVFVVLLLVIVGAQIWSLAARHSVS